MEHLRNELNDSNEKMKHESCVVKNKLNQELADVMIAMEDQDRQINDLQKQLRRQAKQVSVCRSSLRMFRYLVDFFFCLKL